MNGEINGMDIRANPETCFTSRGWELNPKRLKVLFHLNTDILNINFTLTEN